MLPNGLGWSNTTLPAKLCSVPASWGCIRSPEEILQVFWSLCPRQDVLHPKNWH